jgi:hypothetical protein
VFELYDPAGAFVTDFAPYTDLTPVLPQSGEYTVLVNWEEGRDSRLGEYRLGFYRVSSPCDAVAAPLNTTLRGSHELGEIDVFTFTGGPGPITICANSTVFGSSPFIQLYTPTGELLLQGAIQLQHTLDSNATYESSLKEEMRPIAIFPPYQ